MRKSTKTTGRTPWTAERKAKLRATLAAKKNGNGVEPTAESKPDPRRAEQGIRFGFSRSLESLVLVMGEKRYPIEIVD